MIRGKVVGNACPLYRLQACPVPKQLTRPRFLEIPRDCPGLLDGPNSNDLTGSGDEISVRRDCRVRVPKFKGSRAKKSSVLRLPHKVANLPGQSEQGNLTPYCGGDHQMYSIYSQVFVI